MNRFLLNLLRIRQVITDNFVVATLRTRENRYKLYTGKNIMKQTPIKNIGNSRMYSCFLHCYSQLKQKVVS